MGGLRGLGLVSSRILIRHLSPDDLMLRRRPPKAWNESDLDVAYEKKSSHAVSYERQ